MKTPVLQLTTLSVLAIALLAGGTLQILRRMHGRAAAESAAETVIRRGHTMVLHLVTQAHEHTETPAEDWTGWSQFVRHLHAVEHGLQYISVTRDDVVVFHEQTSEPDALIHPALPASPVIESLPEIAIRRALLQTGDALVPVVIFGTEIATVKGPLQIEIALRKDAFNREAQLAGNAISSMFRLSLLTVSIAFGACAVLVVLMMRREVRHEALRAEQEHLAFSGMLADGIVHDFRNPMSSLKLDAQMMEREVARAEKARPERIMALAARLRHTLDRMDEVFKAFLYASRPDSVERTHIDISTCIRDSIATLSSRFERQQIRIEFEEPDAALLVSVFAASLRRALINVLTNAIDFSPISGVITIRIERDGPHAVVKISDQGPGIPVGDWRRVFEMFVTTRPEGTGLGLFLAKTAVERSGGTIAIIAPPEGSGTCLCMTLPLA